MSFQGMRRHAAGGAGVLAIGATFILLNSSLYNVDGGYRAIKFSRLRGILPEVHGEGTHFAIPWLERPIIYDVRAKPRTISSLTGSKGNQRVMQDLQMVNISLRILSKPDELKLTEMYRRLGTDYDERVLPSLVNEVLKSVVAQFNASQLITQREKVSRLIRERLTERANNFFVILEDVSITSLQFGTEFALAVEAKQIAQQEAQRAAFIVDRAFQEKQSIIVKAEGEAQSATMLGEAIAKNPAFLQLRKIEAAREIAQLVAKSSNKIMLNADMLLLNLKDSL